MNTFTVEHAVDFSSGTARIGKVHVIRKYEEMADAMDAERCKKAAAKTRRTDITKERILELKAAGMTLLDITVELDCTYNTICRRLYGVERS